MYAGAFGMDARPNQRQRRRSTIDIGYGIEVGAGTEKKVGDLDNVVGRLLAVAFNAVGRDVVQERGLMATGLVGPN